MRKLSPSSSAVAYVEIATIKDPIKSIFAKFEVLPALEEFRKHGVNTVAGLAGMDYSLLDGVEKMFPKSKQRIEKALQAVSNDLVSGFIDKHLVVTYKGESRLVDMQGLVIGNSANAQLRVRGDISVLDDNSLFEAIIDYQEGNYYLINSRVHPLQDLYVRILPEVTDTRLRPEDSIKAGSLELKVCRFNAGRSEHIGTKPNQEDRSVIIQDLGINPRLDVSFFAVFDG